VTTGAAAVWTLIRLSPEDDVYLMGVEDTISKYHMNAQYSQNMKRTKKPKKKNTVCGEYINGPKKINRIIFPKRPFMMVKPHINAPRWPTVLNKRLA
jgi:hypothetical protein